MSENDHTTADDDFDDDFLAAQYALGLLEAQDLLDARGRMARDGGFSDLVASWATRFVPLFDSVDPVVPAPRVWQAIVASLQGAGQAEVVRLRSRIRRWQIGTAMAASIALVLGVNSFRPAAGPPLPLPAHRESAVSPTLVAALGPKGGGTIGVVYHPADRSLVALGSGVEHRRGHDLELWVIPEGGAPLPLGLVAAGDNRRLTLPSSISAHLVSGSTIAVSLEPIGGSPTGLPTGPVLATAKISAA